MHLNDRMMYRYLGQRKADEMATLCGSISSVALKAIGVSKRLVAQTCQLIAAILHLGNLEFTIDRGRNEEAAVVRNIDVLEIVSELQDQARQGGAVYRVPRPGRSI